MRAILANAADPAVALDQAFAAAYGGRGIDDYGVSN